MVGIFRQLLVSFVLIATAHCQTRRGAVAGTLLDPSGAAFNHPDSSGCPEGRHNHPGGPVPESRFHRKRHSQHVGTGETRVLSDGVRTARLADPAFPCRSLNSELSLFGVDLDPIWTLRIGPTGAAGERSDMEHQSLTSPRNDADLLEFA